MKRVFDYLMENNEKEEMPKWLEDYKRGDSFHLKKALYESKVVYYPGAWVDGQGVRTFNKAHFAHVFLYVDYGHSKSEIQRSITAENAFKGYKLLDIKDLSRKEVLACSPNWTPSVRLTAEQIERMNSFAHHEPYCLACIFERKDEFDETHGAKKFCFIYLCADGIASYDALFGFNHHAPAALILQEHGFGGNYDYFGRGGLLNKIAINTNTFPKYIMCERENVIWEPYSKVKDLDPEVGGMWRNQRFLYIHNKY